MNKNMRFLIFILFSLLSLSAGAVTNQIEIAHKHLLSRQNIDGFFSYEYDFIKDKWTKDNNIVRQAGAGFGLAEWLLTFGLDNETQRHLSKAISAYHKSSVEWKNGLLLTENNSLKKAKGGGTALAMLTAIYYRRVTNDSQFDSVIEGWKRGLISLKRKDGVFWSKPNSKKESHYSNGEIWLALAEYISDFPEDRQTQSLLETLDLQIMNKYNEDKRIEFFHWGVMAATKRYESTGNQVFIDFSIGQAEAYLKYLRPKISKNSNSCYSVEGMLSLYAILADMDKYSDFTLQLKNRVINEMVKNQKLQIQPNQSQVYFDGKNYLFSEAMSYFEGAFLNGRLRPQVRIDATQHCLSALIKVHNSKLDITGN